MINMDIFYDDINHNIGTTGMGNLITVASQKWSTLMDYVGVYCTFVHGDTQVLLILIKVNSERHDELLNECRVELSVTNYRAHKLT